MNRMKLALVVLISLCVIPHTHGQTSLPIDTKTLWKIGIAEFTGINISKENAYLLSSFPHLLVEALSRCDTHIFDEAEQKAYAGRILSRELEKKKKELFQLYRRKDQMLFNHSATQKEMADIDNKIKDMLGVLDQFEQADPDAISIQDEKKVVFLQNGNERILPVVKLNPELYMQEKELDLLIWGTIEEIEGYLLTNVYALNDVLDNAQTFTSASSRDEIAQGRSGIVEQLTHIVLGRQWAGLSITSQPQSGRIWIDNKFVGIGDVKAELIPTGKHELKISAPGYSEQIVAVELSALEERSIFINLEKIAESEIQIITYPAGAAIYTGSQWKGISPLLLQVTDVPAVLSIDKDGYNEASLTINGESEGVLNISLMPDLISKNKLIEDKRDRFYLAFGIFAVSLPLPLILFDVTNQITLAHNYERTVPFAERNNDEINRLEKNRLMAFSSYIGGFFTSAVLLVWTLTELFLYIDLVELSID